MLKQFTGWLLIFTVLTMNYSRLFVYAGFELNQKYIAANLCENRNKPWLHCDGKCFFMKKIKQAEEKEKSDENQSQKDHIQESFFERSSNFKFHTQLLQLISTPYHAPVLPLLIKTIFRPPQIG